MGIIGFKDKGQNQQTKQPIIKHYFYIQKTENPKIRVQKQKQQYSALRNTFIQNQEQQNQIISKSKLRIKQCFIVDTGFTKQKMYSTGLFNSYLQSISLSLGTIKQLKLEKYLLNKYPNAEIIAPGGVSNADLYEGVDICIYPDICQSFFPVLDCEGENVLGLDSIQKLGIEIDLQNGKLYYRKDNKQANFQMAHYLQKLDPDNPKW